MGNCCCPQWPSGYKSPYAYPQTVGFTGGRLERNNANNDDAKTSISPSEIMDTSADEKKTVIPVSVKLISTRNLNVILRFLAPGPTPDSPFFWNDFPNNVKKMVAAAELVQSLRLDAKIDADFISGIYTATFPLVVDLEEASEQKYPNQPRSSKFFEALMRMISSTWKRMIQQALLTGGEHSINLLDVHEDLILDELKEYATFQRSEDEEGPAYLNEIPELLRLFYIPDHADGNDDRIVIAKELNIPKGRAPSADPAAAWMNDQKNEKEDKVYIPSSAVIEATIQYFGPWRETQQHEYDYPLVHILKLVKIAKEAQHLETDIDAKRVYYFMNETLHHMDKLETAVDELISNGEHAFNERFYHHYVRMFATTWKVITAAVIKQHGKHYINTQDMPASLMNDVLRPFIQFTGNRVVGHSFLTVSVDLAKILYITDEYQATQMQAAALAVELGIPVGHATSGSNPLVVTITDDMSHDTVMTIMRLAESINAKYSRKKGYPPIDTSIVARVLRLAVLASVHADKAVNPDTRRFASRQQIFGGADPMSINTSALTLFQPIREMFNYLSMKMSDGHSQIDLFAIINDALGYSSGGKWLWFTSIKMANGDSILAGLSLTHEQKQQLGSKSVVMRESVCDMLYKLFILGAVVIKNEEEGRQIQIEIAPIPLHWLILRFEVYHEHSERYPTKTNGITWTAMKRNEAVWCMRHPTYRPRSYPVNSIDETGRPSMIAATVAWSATEVEARRIFPAAFASSSSSSSSAMEM